MGALDDDFAIGGSEAFATNQVLSERFGGGGDTTPLAAVVPLPEGTTIESQGVAADLRALERALGDALPGARVASYGSTGDRTYVSDDGATTFALAFPRSEGGQDETLDPALLDAAERAVDGARVGDAQALLPGQGALAETTGAGAEAGILSETLLAGVAALVVLAIVFASALALVPLLMAVVAFPTTMLAVLGLTSSPMSRSPCSRSSARPGAR